MFSCCQQERCFGANHGLGKAFKYVPHGKDLELSEFKQHMGLGKTCIKPELQLTRYIGKPTSAVCIVLGVAGMVLIFFIVAHMMLCFRFVSETMLVTHYFLSFAEQHLRSAKTLSLTLAFQ